MITLESIKKPINAQVEQYEQRVREWLHSDYKNVADILDYVLKSRGKSIRPMLVLLVHALHSKENSSQTQDRAYLGAMLIEMIHTASLLHDDVIDEAYVRRGKPSVNALWRSKAAVLAGDYILAKSYTIGLESGGTDVLTFINRSMSALCEGELIQSKQSERLEMTRQIYIDIINKKTASLIAASSASGALAANATPEEVEAMRLYGENLGIAFQIKDDILDYSSAATIGKPICGDLRERKITLPLLSVLDSVSEGERRRLIALLSDVRSNPANVELLYDIVKNSGGIEKAELVMMEYIGKAKAVLHDYAPSPIKDSLLAICDYVCGRDK